MHDGSRRVDIKYRLIPVILRITNVESILRRRLVHYALGGSRAKNFRRGACRPAETKWP
jgi:hypothetical protein